LSPAGWRGAALGEIYTVTNVRGPVTLHLNLAHFPEGAELQAKGVDVMAEMFEKDVAGFTEERDPNAEPGEIAGEAEAAEAEAPADAEAGEGDETTEA
jgi:large subunit ribosomal protein L9